MQAPIKDRDVIYERIMMAVNGYDEELVVSWLDHLLARANGECSFVCPVCWTKIPVQKRKLHSTIVYDVCNACGLKYARVISGRESFRTRKVKTFLKSAADTVDTLLQLDNTPSTNTNAHKRLKSE